MNILEFNNVTKNIYNFHLRNTNIVLRKGEILGIVGQNGSGKTTIAKLITNFYRPKTGDIEIFGLDSVKDSKKIKKDLSVIPQSNWFNESMRPISLLKNTLRSRNIKNNEEINFLLDYFDVKLSRKIGLMSFLDKRKLAIINGLVSNSELIIVDEPETINDPATRLKLYDILEEKNRAGASIIIFFSDLKEAQSICDNIYYLHKGEIIEEEDQSRKLSNDKILKFYDKNVNREIFDSIGAKLVKSDVETSYYYNGPLNLLSEAIYRVGLIDYTIEDSTLDEKLVIIEKDLALKREGRPTTTNQNHIVRETQSKNVDRRETKIDENKSTLEQTAVIKKVEPNVEPNNVETKVSDDTIIQKRDEFYETQTKVINSSTDNNSSNNTQKIEIKSTSKEENHDINK